MEDREMLNMAKDTNNLLAELEALIEAQPDCKNVDKLVWVRDLLLELEEGLQNRDSSSKSQADGNIWKVIY
jgi:hypothetical protein